MPFKITVQHYRSLTGVSLQHAWLTIGVFDGVHRGHQAILEKLSAKAHQHNAPAVLLTFDPHPASVLAGREIKLLTTPEERSVLAAALGIDVVITLSFDQSLANVSARDFMERLQSHLGLHHLLIGYDFALGKGREGNAGRLTELGRELGYTVQVMEAVIDESGVISSTEIRKLVSLGSVDAAAGLLGRPYTLTGTVVHGDGRGRRINIPTANLDYPASRLVPANGIYACRARLGAELWPAAVNIGFNPTFTPDKQTVTVEAHLLDFHREIYGEMLTLEFLSHLRSERKFDSVDALLTQIHADIEQTRQIVAKSP